MNHIISILLNSKNQLVQNVIGIGILVNYINEVLILDQKKIGEFLRELRKAKGLTQEQVANHFNIAGRTVSRWETGSNMPDIGIISEIADFYEVDIRELINGERDTSEVVQEDTVAKVIEYADTENEKLTKNVAKFSAIGIVSMLVFVLVAKYGVGGDGVVASLIESVAMFFVCFALSRSLLFSMGRLGKHLEDRKKNSFRLLLVRIILIIFLVIILFIALSSGLMVGAA